MNKKNSYLKKSILIITFISIILSAFIVPVEATIIANLDFVNVNSQQILSRTMAGATGGNSGGAGESFQTTSAGYVTSLLVEMQRYGSPVATVNAHITSLASQAANAAYNADIATSASIELSASTLSDTGYYMVDFIFDGTVQLQDDTWYAWYITVDSVTTIDGNNYLIVGESDSGSSVYSGYRWYYNTEPAWHNVATGDLCFYIDADASAPPTPTPTPTASPTPSPSPTPVPEDVSHGIWAAITPYANLLLPLFVIIVIALLCAKFGGVWGFFAGLNVGYVICYIFNFLPLWGMVALLVVDGLLLFGKVGLGDRNTGG